MKRHWLLSLLLFTGLLQAQEKPLVFATLTTRTGLTYTDVKVTRYDATEVRFIHSGGAAVVLLGELPRDIQDIFGYDPRKADSTTGQRHEQRTKAIVEMEKDKLALEALRRQQKQESDEIRAHEKRGVRLRVLVRVVENGACLCQAWRIEKIDVPKKYDLSGKPMQVDGIKQQVPYWIRVSGMEEVPVGHVTVAFIYPGGKFDVTQDHDYQLPSSMHHPLPFAIRGDVAWRLQKNAAAANPERVAPRP